MFFDKQMIVMTAATLLSGIHGNNGQHTADQIKRSVETAVAIAKEVEAIDALLNPPQQQQA